MKITIEGKSSGRGLSYWTQFLRDPCMRKIRLAGELDEATESSDALQRGVVFHKLAELYHTGQLTMDRLADGFDFVKPDGSTYEIGPKALSEAMTLATHWFTGVAPNGLGEVLGAEVKFPAPDGPARAALNAILPHLDEGFTGAADLVTRIRSMSEAALVADAFSQMGAPLPMDLDPGIWLWDFKTVTDVSSAFRYESGYQEINYPWLFSLDNPDLRPEIRGFIYLVISIGRKRVPEPSIEVVVHPFPNEEKISAMIRRLNAAKRVKDALMVDEDAPNRDACAPKYANYPWCPFLTNGQCNGY